MTFLQKLDTSIQRNNSLLCIGLDTDVEKLPEGFENDDYPQFTFNKQIIDATYDIVCSYKLQIAYYSAFGTSGLEALKQSVEYIKSKNPDLPVILDAKRADIGSTSEKYAEEAFDVFLADAVTVNPYLGSDGLEPFLKRDDKGVIILCRTSNPGAKDFQDLLVNGRPLYLHVAEKINTWHQQFGNCLLVVGATYPEEMKEIRKVVPDLYFLVPGIGAQGGDLEKTLEAGLRNDKSGLIIHSSRSIIYASNGPDFAEKAREEATTLRDRINLHRK